MLFLHPMWDSETQRVGMQRCWKAAYLVHVWGELIGFLGLCILLGSIAFMIYQVSLKWSLLFLAFGMGIISEAMIQVSWHMVAKRGFEYDFHRREATWQENGQQVKYKHGQQSDH